MKVQEMVKEFRSKLKGTKFGSKEVEKIVLEGLTHARAEVRAIAAKTGIKNFDRKWVKSNVLTLLEKEPSKKVIRVFEKTWSGQKVKAAWDRYQKANAKAIMERETAKKAAAEATEKAEAAAKQAAAVEETKAEE